MSKKANPTVIGIFVLAGFAIAVAAILVLGSGKLFKQVDRYVMFFEGSLAGLDVGAPVEYLGVRIGTVSEIRLQYDTDLGQAVMPVFVEIDPKRIVTTGTSGKRRGLSYSINKGLRAQLQSQSMVTGKLKVMLLLAPGTEPSLQGLEPGVPEIPTIATFTESLAKTVSDLPMAEIVINIHSTLQAVAEIVQSGQLQEVLANINQTATDTRELVAYVKKDTPALMTNLVESTELLEVTLLEFDMILHDIRPMVSNLTAFAPTMGQLLVDNADLFKNTQTEIIKAVSHSRRVLSEDSPVRYQLMVTMDRVAEAAKTIQVMVDYLERHPESFLSGKPAGGDSNE